MTRNSLAGLIGVTLLVFVVAFAVGRWTRPSRVKSTAALSRTSYAPESLGVSESESTRLLTAAQTAAYEEEDLAPAPAVTRPTVSVEERSNSRRRAVPTALSASAPDTTPDSEAKTSLALATDSLAPKPVLAKDYAAIAERQKYAAQLPKELLAKGVEAQVNVVGEQAEVIILTSSAFDAQSKDSLIKQVCIDLKSLGFKRVHLTDGADYTLHFGL